MNITWMRISLAVASLLTVANVSAAQNPQYQLLDLGAPVGGTGAFQFIPARLSSGGQVVAPVAVDGGRITREWDALNGWRDVAGPNADFPYTDAAAVNVFGAVVGRAFNSAFNVLHAFVWIDGVTFDLNALGIQSSDGWILSYANDINDSGMILGRGIVASQQHDFALLPLLSSDTTTTSRPASFPR